MRRTPYLVKLSILLHPIRTAAVFPWDAEDALLLVHPADPWALTAVDLLYQPGLQALSPLPATAVRGRTGIRFAVTHRRKDRTGNEAVFFIGHVVF